MIKNSNPDAKPMEILRDILLFNPQWIQEPYSWVGHIPFASWLVQKIKPRIYVELGTYTGNSYFAVCQSVKQYNTGTMCFAVDTWQGDAHAKYYGEEVYEMVKNHNDNEYAVLSKLLRMSFDEALNQFDDNTVDLLHIDGLHTYDAVKHDFESWFPKLAPNSIVMFHDIKVLQDDFGVWKYWAELKQRFHNWIEFDHCYGLGVLQIKKDNNSPAVIDSPFESTVIDFLKSIGNIYESSGMYARIPLLWPRVPWQVEALLKERDQFLQKQISMKNSLSWKLTSPLRLLDSFFTKARGNR